MLEVVLSGDACAVPPFTAGRDAFNEYVQRLLDWRALVDTELVAFFLSERTIDALMLSEQYPLGPRLYEMINGWGIDDVSANDLLRIANDLLGRSEFLEDRIGVDDVLHSGLTSVPDVVASCGVASLRDDLEHLLALLAAAEGNAQANAHRLVLSVSQKTSHSIELLISIDLAEPRIGMPGAVAHLAFPALKTVRVLSAHDMISTIAHADEIDLWCAAGSARQAEAVVRFSVLKNRPQDDPDFSWDSIHRFTIRPEFIQSCAHYGFLHDPPKVRRVLSALTDIVLARDQGHGHALREGEGGNEPVRLRGEDVAWRHDVDYEFHVHLWRCKCGLLEFAALVTHNDYNIPQ